MAEKLRETRCPPWARGNTLPAKEPGSIESAMGVLGSKAEKPETRGSTLPTEDFGSIKSAIGVLRLRAELLGESPGPSIARENTLLTKEHGSIIKNDWGCSV